MNGFDGLYYPDPLTGLPRKVETVMDYFLSYVGSLSMQTDVVNGMVISTVFLGFDKCSGEGPRVLTFETRVFPYGLFPSERNSHWVRGYATPEESYLGHEAAKQMVINGDLKTPICLQAATPLLLYDTPPQA